MLAKPKMIPQEGKWGNYEQVDMCPFLKNHVYSICLISLKSNSITHKKVK